MEKVSSQILKSDGVTIPEESEASSSAIVGETCVSLEDRYQLLEKIGTGTYATVFRARDLELGREVAIRQVNEKYLANPDQLDRYWQEAQLLASLQHPNIVTLFDLDRVKGWVILELMQASLKDRVRDRQLDLKSLRTTLAHSLRALKYLHSQGIVHGDIKPANLMLDARRRIKLGDFGLARRASDADGELLKGTTKYMAPETVSDDFGEIGPASDLYSLGFSAYELLCGSNFDTLFPGLSAFGSDEQIAWMMWHAAPDRKLPEIRRVLEGVPEDLQKVIQKLTAKDQKDRYKSADEAMADLDIDSNLTGLRPALEQADSQSSAEDDQDGGRTPEEKKRLMMIAGVFAISMVMSLVMMFMGGSGENSGEAEGSGPPQLIGYVRDIDLENGIIIYNDLDYRRADEIKVGKSPKIYFRNNDENILLREIQKNDRITVEKQKVGDKYELKIEVDRPETTYGALVSRDLQNNRITIEIQEGSERGNLSLRVPERARIKINNQTKKLVELADGDTVRIRHFPETTGKSGRVVGELIALRAEEMTGYISNLKMTDPPELAVRFGRTSSSATATNLPLAEDVKIVQAGGSAGGQAPLEVTDLKEGDRVRIKYDVEIREILVTREDRQTSGVIRELDGQALTVSQDDGQVIELELDKNTEVTINADDATSDDLRAFDRLILTWDDSTDPPRVVAVDSKRPILNDRWAILIANESYSDRSLTPAENAVSDMQMLKSSLIKRYAFSEDRVLLLIDEKKSDILKTLQDTIALTRRDSQVLVFVKGHAYRAADQNLYLAVKDTNSDQLTKTGLSLLELVKPLEEATTSKKILMLEVCSAVGGKDLEGQPSSGEALQYLASGVKSTTIIAACQPDQKSLEVPTGDSGVFAVCLSEAFRGSADTDKNLRLSADELMDFLNDCLHNKAPSGQTQTPVLHQPAP